MGASKTPYSRLLDNQEAMAETLTDVQVKVGRIETSIEGMKDDRDNTRVELAAYRLEHTQECADNVKAHQDIWKGVSNLTAWLRGMSVAWGILAVVLVVVMFVVK